MAGDPTVGDNTVADHDPSGMTRADSATLPLAGDGPPEPAPLARVVAKQMALASPQREPSRSSSMSISNAADALRDEEIERTRLFMVVGWLVSIVAIGTLPFVEAPRVTAIIFVAALVIGMIVSAWLYRRFADPAKYTEGALHGLALMCMINGHIAVFFYGPFTAAPVVIVVGIHFVARTELERVAKSIVICASICYGAMAGAIIAGVPDLGAFAPEHRFAPGALLVATLFVIAAYWFAYYVARMFRAASLTSIDELQHATRLASQREALMEELRADLEQALQVGGPGRYTDQVVGSFRLGIVLGRGAMGEVYEATRVADDSPAAMKLLRREMLTDATQVARFVREARASAAIDSPYVVRVLETSSEGDVLPYLAMERLYGQTLSELLRREPRLPPASVVELCQHVGAAIDASRTVGIVHRDLKPQNLMHAADGVWKVLDFGIASLADEAGKLTRGEVVGTPHYMAPEQAQGKTVDHRADLYALATIAYRCLTGHYPFTAGDTPALLYAVVHRMPVQPTTLAELPADVDRWCAIAMAKDPDARFASGAELAATLAAALTDSLDGKLRRRADALIRKHRWEVA